MTLEDAERLAYGVMKMSVDEFRRTPCASFWRKASYHVEHETERLRLLLDHDVRCAAYVASMFASHSERELYALWTGRDWQDGRELTREELIVIAFKHD